MLKQLIIYYEFTGEFYCRETGHKLTSKRPMINGVRYSLHQLAWFFIHGEWPDFPIYMINGDANDLRGSNLTQEQSEACRMQPNGKKKVSTRNQSGVTGVSYQNRDSLWIATIMIKGKRKYLGSFTNLESAIKARENGERSTMFM